MNNDLRDYMAWLPEDERVEIEKRAAELRREIHAEDKARRNTKTIIVRVTASTEVPYSEVYADVEFDIDVWNGMTEAERRAVLRETAFGMITWGYREP